MLIYCVVEPLLFLQNILGGGLSLSLLTLFVEQITHKTLPR